MTTVGSGLSRLSHEQTINELTDSFRIEQEYTDDWGWVHPTSLETKRNVLSLNPMTSTQAPILKWMTPAKLFRLNEEDVFREAQQQNLPGTTSPYPDWSLTIKYMMDRLRSDPEVWAFCNMFRNVVRRDEIGQ